MSRMRKPGFVCKWDDFSLNATTIFKEMQSRKEYEDVALGCTDGGGQFLKGHRLVLSSFSTVLEDMFEQFSRGPFRSNNVLIFLSGIKFADLADILDFMYQGEVSIDEERMPSFLSAAEELKIVGIYDKDGGDEQMDQGQDQNFNILDKRNDRLSKNEFNFSSENKNFNKYSKALKEEFLQNKRGSLDSRGNGVVLEKLDKAGQMSFDDETFRDETFRDESFRDDTFRDDSYRNIKLDPDFSAIKNEVVLEPIDYDNIGDGLNGDMNGMDFLNGSENFDQVQDERIINRNRNRKELEIDTRIVDRTEPRERPERPERKEREEKPTTPKDQKSRSKCKICGIEGRNDKIRKHIKEAHFAKAKAELAEPPKEAQEPEPDTLVPANFDKESIEFFDHEAHWDPQWNQIISSEPDIFPRKWIRKFGKSWLEYMPNDEDILKSKLRCRICVKYLKEHELGKQKILSSQSNNLSPLAEETGSLKSSSELNRKMLIRHMNSDVHRYTMDFLANKRQELRNETEASVQNSNGF